MPQPPLQHSLADFTCYGCGPANPDGLQLQSTWDEAGQFVIARFEPQAKYNAGMPNTMYGGVIASLIDCHSLWTVMAFAYREEDRAVGSVPLIIYVTGELNVKYLRPTPLDCPTYLKAWVSGEIGRRTVVECELGPEGSITATGRVTAVRIDPPR